MLIARQYVIKLLLLEKTNYFLIFKLDGKGLALTFFLRRAFQKDIISSINNFKAKSESTINKLLTEENFDTKKFDAGTLDLDVFPKSGNFYSEIN
jgi:hypothetical protein